MHPTRLSAVVAKQVLRAPSCGPSVCATRRPAATAFLPRRLGSRPASSTPSTASSSQDASPSSSSFSSSIGQSNISDNPSSASSSLSAGVASTPTSASSAFDLAAPSSSALDPAAPSTTAAPASPTSEKDGVDPDGPRSPPVKPKAAKKKPKKVPVVKREIREDESFLPPDWQDDLQAELEAVAVAQVEKRAARVARQGMVALLPKTQAPLEPEAASLLAETILRLRADACARAAERILGGFLVVMEEFEELVVETNDWLREAAKADALSEAFRYDVGTLRTDLLKHAEDRDIVKDAAGAPVLDAHGVPQPGPFQTLLRTDQAAWDRFVEDPGYLKEEESYTAALAKIQKEWYRFENPARS